MKTKHTLAAAAVALGMLATTAAAHPGEPPDPADPAGERSDLRTARKATAPYHHLSAAKVDGYDLFTDAQGVECIDNPGVGGMGVHYVKGDLVGDGAVDAATPEALVYEPRPHGRMRLVAVEYVVFQDAWDAENDSPPELFGREFSPIPATNRYGLPSHYELHAWIWKFNPRGLFDDWNPRVSCQTHARPGGGSGDALATDPLRAPPVALHLAGTAH